MLILFHSLGADDLIILSEINAPFSMENSDEPGIAVEILDYMLQFGNSDQSVNDILYYPWARSYKMAREQDGILLFPMAKTEEREPLFRWVGPIYKMRIGLIAGKDRNFLIETVEDLADLKIGIVRDGAPEQLLVEAGTRKSSLIKLQSIEQMLQMLSIGRVDAIAYNIPSTFYCLKSMGENPADYEEIYLLREVELYYAFSADTDTALIEDFQSHLDLIKEMGLYNRIIDGYIK